MLRQHDVEGPVGVRQALFGGTDGQHPQRRAVMRAPHGVTPLNKEGGAYAAFVVVEAGDGEGLG